MDETDLRLINLLILDSRTPYAVLSRRLKMSIPAIHKRVTALHDAGVITKFTANLSGSLLHAVPVYVWGVSDAFPLRKAVGNLQRNDLTSFVITGSGNLLHLHALLPSLQDLGAYVAFVQEAASMPNPQVGLVDLTVFGRSPPFPRTSPEVELDGLDYRIVRSLHTDARKSIADVCEEIHASPKTVRNRLRRMVGRGALEFSIEAQPGLQAFVSAFLPIQLQPGADVVAFLGRMTSELDPWIVWAWSFSNLPNALTALTASPTSEAHEALVDRISSYPGVEKLSVHVVSHYDFFTTWRDTLLAKRADGGRA